MLQSRYFYIQAGFPFEFLFLLFKFLFSHWFSFNTDNFKFILLANEWIKKYFRFSFKVGSIIYVFYCRLIGFTRTIKI